MNKAVLAEALRLVAEGVSVLPIEADGSKRPALDEWKTLTERLPAPEELTEWFSVDRLLGIATIGGSVSGNLEQLDFDHLADSVYPQWRELVEAEYPGLCDRLTIIRTPSVGYHVKYRVEHFEIPGNTKLALSADNRVLIETRGEGGYTLAPGCPPECHKTGRTYEHLGSPTTPTITAAEREILIRAAKSFDEPPPNPPKTSSNSNGRHSSRRADDLLPGDDYDHRGPDWADILEPHGWRCIRARSGERHWRRPSKDDPGMSATTGHCQSDGDDLLKVFSTNAYPFEGGGVYGKFRAYALLNHGGDLSAAASALSLLGYGSPAKSPRARIGPMPATAEDAEKETLGTDGFRLTDVGNANRIASAHGAEMRFSHSQKTWYIWNGSRWLADDTGEAVRRTKDAIDRLIRETARLNGEWFVNTSPERKEMMATLRRQLQHGYRWEHVARIVASLKMLEDELPVAVASLDANAWLLNVANGTIDLRTGLLQQHKRDDFITKLAPVAYDPDADCPTWTRCLEQWMQENSGLIAYLQRIVGYALTADIREQALFFFYGGGSNGKTTFLTICREMLGDYAIQTVSELLMARSHESHPTERADLMGRRFVATVETDEGKRMAESLMKQLTGGETIRARRMRQDFFEFSPTWKIFLAANHKPVIKGNDFAVWRRIKLIPFLATIKEENKDPNLVEKLRSELPGILAWAVRGCLDWQRFGLAEPPEVTAATAAYQKDQDTLAAFISECCTVGSNYKAATGPLLSIYQAWSGDKYMTPRQLIQKLGEKGYECTRSHGKRYIQGIGLDSECFDDGSEDRF